MDYKQMVEGGKAALLVLVFTVGVAITIGVSSFIGLFVGGSLESAATTANFSTEVSAGFTTTVSNLITNITSIQTPFGLWTSLLSVILVLGVFGGLVYLGVQQYKKSKGGSEGGSMGY